ncbi:MAG TPA: Hsp20 family protein [Patescibacteria group bacterium]|nr:Hsp20 family protein [Patescibacteria group bacterium]
MREEGAQLQRTEKQTTPLRLVNLDEIFKDMRQTFDEIARRAYDIFESNGRQFGLDMEDWFRAERELLHPLHLEITESDNAVTVRAEVPGFEVKDLEVGIEGRQLTIAGKRESASEQEKEKVLYSERRSNQLFRRIELPTEVDAEKTAATLKGGVLELKLPKIAPTKKVRIEPKAA